MKSLAKGRGKVLDARIIAVDPYLRETGDDPFPPGYYFKPKHGICFGWQCWHGGEHGAALSQESLRNHIMPALAEYMGVELSELNERFVGLVKG